MAKTPTRAARPAQAAQTVKALVPVSYDHAMQEPGDTFEVRTEDLDQLLEVNAVELVDAAEAPAA
jgi:hypothetical protein